MTPRNIRTLFCVPAAVLVLLAPGAARAEIIASLEVPAPAAERFSAMTGVAPLQGWAFTTVPGASITRLVDVFIDGEFAFNAPCCSDRADVESVFAAAPRRSGFSAAYNWQLVGSGVHELRVVIRSTAGEVLSIRRTIETFRPFGRVFLSDVTTSGGSCFVLGDPASSLGTALVGLSGLTFRTARSPLPWRCPAGASVVLRWDRARQDFKTVVRCDAGSASQAFLSLPADLIE